MSIWWSNTTRDNDLGLTNVSGYPYLFGIKITSAYNGKYLDQASFWLKRKNSPNGSVTARVLDSSGSDVETSSTSFASSSISDSDFEKKTFAFSGLQVSTGYYIMIDCSTVTTDDPAVIAAGTDTNSQPSWDRQSGSSTLNEYTDRQTTFEFSGTAPSSGGTRFPPPPIHLRRF